ncbi:hypothetical protein I316_06294 [Kwoniella heveanensis BCC8398]|uniref:Amino acid permease/ SLC12A domain-containing protein n=1 Tax=Kwoniella heveanensis BCC8398 TaxID=1296120 RepID=A0A1B9GMB2_9TREE|nr:hypothetical protein I316_06294 [Kwoniella heveanensis BCC8398]
MPSNSIHELTDQLTDRPDIKDDVVVHDIQEVNQGDSQVADPGLKRSLKSRHMQMLAIGGIIGPGYFVGIGNGFTNGGPAGLLLGFGIVGVLLWLVMQSLAEMGSFLAVSGSFTNYTTRFLDPALGFSLGWNYAFLWFGILGAEYNNLGIVMTYWRSALPNWGFILIFWVVFLAFSYLGVLAFGEAEFALTLMKLLFIGAFFLCSILITTAAIGSQGKIGFKFYNDPGAFADGVSGVFKVFVFAALQYSGTEMIGLTAGESANPARDVPKAVRFVFWRVLVVFLGGIFFLSLCVPWNDPTLLSGANKTARSPFVISFVNAGLPRGGDAVNAIIIITILSALNGALYVSSRTVSALAHQQQAPKFLGHINKRGVPTYALIFCNLFGFISLLNLSSGAGHVYDWLVNITGVATFITWGGICWAHIRFRKALALQGISLDELPFKAAFYPYGAWIGLCGNLFFIFFQGWTAFLSPFSVEDFFKNYIMIPVFLIMYLGYKFWNKTKWVDLTTADLATGRREIGPEQAQALKDIKQRSIGRRVLGAFTG